MAEGDWLDIRGWVEALSFAIADNTVGMSRFWRQKGTTADILTELIMAVVVFGLIMTTMLVLLWIERKFFARIMDRRGATMAMRSLWVGEGGEHVDWYGLLPFGTGAPFRWLNRWLNKVAGSDHEVESVARVRDRSYHGIWWMLPGFFQNIADAVKFLTKEWMVPTKADKVVFEVAPFIIISSTIMLFAFIPLGPHVWSANPDLSLLFLMAIFGIAPLGVFFAGWSSNNKYTLIGGIRSAAQLTAYEIPLLVTVLAVAVLSGSMNIIEIVEFQMDMDGWTLFLLPLGAALFLITMIAEVERIPFDMPEAEAELVEGWWTEYGGLRWGLLFMAEYLRAYAACLLFAIFFLGGWEPFGGNLVAQYTAFIPGIAWLLIKSWLMFAVFVWVRASLHRVRTDQILEFGWRWLLPLSLVNLGIAVWLRLGVWQGDTWSPLVIGLITTIAIALFVLLAIDEDPTALEGRERPYSVHVKAGPAGPGTHKK